MTIRVADTAGDARGIAEVHVASWRAAYRGVLPRRYLSAMSVDSLTEHWTQRIQGAGRFAFRSDDLWVVEAEDRVIGFASIGPCLDDEELAGFAGEVQMLYIHPEMSGQGLGRALFDHVLGVLAKRDYRWLVVWVLEHNKGARQFYERMGLQADGSTATDHSTGQGVSVVRYAKALNPVIDFDALWERSLTKKS